jgi:ParB family chromosome partitioning protein
LARRKEIYETLHPEAKDKVLQALSMHRKLGHNAGETVSPAFTKDTAQKTGLTQRTIQGDIQIATRILPEVRDVLRSTELADSKRDLLRIARLEPGLGHNVSTN